MEKTRPKRGLVGKLLLLTAMLAGATGPIAAAPVTECADAADRIAWQQCLSGELDDARKTLYEVHRTVIAYLDHLADESRENPTTATLAAGYVATRETLLIAQIQWSRFVDSDCNTRSQFVAPGTATAAEGLLCQLDHTRARTEELKSLTAPCFAAWPAHDPSECVQKHHAYVRQVVRDNAPGATDGS